MSEIMPLNAMSPNPPFPKGSSIASGLKLLKFKSSSIFNKLNRVLHSLHASKQLGNIGVNK